MAKLVAQGGKTDLDRLGAYESAFKEGDRGILELDLAWTPPGMDTLLDGLDWVLRRSGVNLTRDSTIAGDTVRIYFEKGIPPLVLIAAALVGAWVIMLSSWKLFREEARELGLFIFILIGVVLAAAVYIAVKGKIATPTVTVGG